MNKIALSAIALSLSIFLPLYAYGATMQVTTTINSIQIPERATELYAYNTLAFYPASTGFQFAGEGRISIVRDAVGTITSITNNSPVSGTATIIGSGTNFTAMFAVSGWITINSESHQISAITDDTHMKTSTNWTNTSGGAYAGVVMASSPDSTTFNGSYVNSSGTTVPGTSASVAFPYDSTLTPYSVHLELYTSLQSSVVCKADCTPVLGGSGWYYLENALNFYVQPNNSAYNCTASGNSCSWQQVHGCINPLCSGYTTSLAVNPSNVVYVSGGYPYWRSPTLCTINSTGQCQ